MKLKCKRHNKVSFISYGFLGFKSKAIKTKIEGLTRGKVYTGHFVQQKVWTPDYDETHTYMKVCNDAGEWRNYDINLFIATEES